MDAHRDRARIPQLPKQGETAVEVSTAGFFLLLHGVRKGMKAADRPDSHTKDRVDGSAGFDESEQVRGLDGA